MLERVFLFSFINIGLLLLLIILSVILLKINKKKFIFGAVITVIYGGIVLYYLCLIPQYSCSVIQKLQKEEIMQKNIPAPVKESTEAIQKSPDFTVIITTEDSTFTLAPEGELEIKKGTKFKIEKVVYSTNNTENIKADIRGFAGNQRENDLQDIGYWATYKDMIKKYAVNEEKNKFEIEIKEDKNVLGKVYIKFID
ncbi:MAG: hypothetical protein N3D17_05930 [bacterium]|nr:hypothetical protein [bacterium]